MPRDSRVLQLAIQPKDLTDEQKSSLLLQSVGAADGGEYVIPLPGAMPPGFHLSIHPSGRMNLKARGLGRIATVNLQHFYRGIQSPAVDRFLVRFFSPPPRWRSAEGIVVSAGTMERLRGGPAGGVIALDDFMEWSTRVEIRNTCRIAEGLRTLRNQGVLAKGSLFLLSPGWSMHEFAFVDILGRPQPSLPSIALPAAAPLSRTVSMIWSQLRTYGGLFVRCPRGHELERLARLLGLAELYEAFAEAIENADNTLFERRSGGFVHAVKLWADDAVSQWSEESPIRAA